MNPLILKSLEHLHRMQLVTMQEYQLPDQNQLLKMRGIPGFHCLNTGSVTKELPEVACFMDTE